MRNLSSIFSVATPQLILLVISSNSTFAFRQLHRSSHRPTCVALFSLKAAAIPLLSSGKALARCGEVLIEYTTSLDVYGGSLSATGASLRNAGDSVAQAAASCRFKTGAELVSDELREAATCIIEGTKLLPQAIEEAREDNDEVMACTLGSMELPMKQAGVALEAAGAAVMQHGSGAYLHIVGERFVACGESLRSISELILELPVLPIKFKLRPAESDGNALELTKLCSQRMQYSARKMIEAGNNLLGVEKEKPTGKSWLKSGT